MYVFIIYCLLLVITISTTFDNQDQHVKVDPIKNVFNVEKHGLKQPCCGNSFESDGHSVKKYPEVIIFLMLNLIYTLVINKINRYIDINRCL